MFHLQFSSKAVNEDDSTKFKKSLVGPIRTNNSATKLTVEGLEPYTVYAFHVQAVNKVGVSRPSKQSYPAITLMESKDYRTCVQCTGVLMTVLQSQVVSLAWWQLTTRPPPPSTWRGVDLACTQYTDSSKAT